jgi:isoleucyl-tRNA synthetase
LTQKILKLLEALALAALSILIGELAWTIERIRPKLEVTISNLDRTIIIAGATATHLEQASRAWQKASELQAGQTSVAMSNVSAAAARLTTFVSKTDDSVNTRLLPALTTSIEEQNASLLESQQALRENLSQMLLATAQLQKTLAAAEMVVADPEIKTILADADEDVKQLKPMLEAGTATAEDVQRVADKIAAQYTKARNIWLGGAQWLLQKAWELRGAVGF